MTVKTKHPVAFSLDNSVLMLTSYVALLGLQLRHTFVG